MLTIEIVQLAIRKRALEGELKIDIAYDSFVDIENDRGWQIFGIFLPGHCAPGRVGNVAWQRGFGAAVGLLRDRPVFGGVLDPQQPQILVWIVCAW